MKNVVKLNAPRFIVSQITMLLTNLKFHKTNTNLFENIDYYYKTLPLSYHCFINIKIVFGMA